MLSLEGGALDSAILENSASTLGSSPSMREIFVIIFSSSACIAAKYGKYRIAWISNCNYRPLDAFSSEIPQGLFCDRDSS
ncbi:hypothetical protein [Rhodospirillum sp. A1_3_36]|uniref:hypothetical protein n=1 Tax=Rhodospirillum sp. A1_3_36 TaxID=3391666 RepID=UPI0039A6EBFA